MLWLVVAFFLLVYKVAAYHSFVRYICASSIPADVELLESFGKIVEEKKIKKILAELTSQKEKCNLETQKILEKIEKNLRDLE